MQGRVFDLDALHLAPYGYRLAAGLIDFLPALSPMLILLRPGFATPAHIVQVAEFASAPFYLLHTTIIESLFGRSLGKMCLGLSVVSIDGGSPSLGSLIIRNLLRAIDVCLLFLPLAVILFSPLRQRTGDVAAGTLVVYRPPPAKRKNPKRHSLRKPPHPPSPRFRTGIRPARRSGHSMSVEMVEEVEETTPLKAGLFESVRRRLVGTGFQLKATRDEFS